MRTSESAGSSCSGVGVSEKSFPRIRIRVPERSQIRQGCLTDSTRRVKESLRCTEAYESIQTRLLLDATPLAPPTPLGSKSTKTEGPRHLERHLQSCSVQKAAVYRDRTYWCESVSLEARWDAQESTTNL